ncbi:YjgN family protein [Aquabacterium sp. A7-Y]|uniref:YjgN family protein n=1 Tax=Aquabacterium sp. A7-Y TaxID=1349605 RepID=UPI00223E8D46|nr:YjgN family protein [Aquabacterium sp. A7-Y]MCW7538851.1 YjgN family protein [Aquabacterium sp. A7-Y]
MNTTSLLDPARPVESPAPSGLSRPAPAWSSGVVDSGGITGMVSSIDADPPRNSVFSRLLHPRQAHHIPVEFTASGSEYFRIWIVNLLLTFVTLGFYYPWAKVRKLRYFYANTQIAGQGLDFHGQPRKMLRGTMLAGVLWALYSQAMELSALSALVAAVLVSALLPALVRAALQFRLAHTSWRGLRFAFAGNSRKAYAAMLAPLVLGLVSLALLSHDQDVQASQLLGLDIDQQWINIAALVVFAALLLVAPYFFWRLKKYQHDHFRLAQLQTELRLGAGPVYGVFLRSFGLMALLPLLLGGIALLAYPGAGKDPGGWLRLTMMLAGIAFLGGMLYFYVVVSPYFQTRMQNLLWTKTGNRYLRLRSELQFRRYLLLQLKNYLLVTITLGLYWPWAAVATRRLRLEAVTLVSRIDIDELYMALRPPSGDAAADMGDELMGFELGI